MWLSQSASHLMDQPALAAHKAQAVGSRTKCTPTQTVKSQPCAIEAVYQAGLNMRKDIIVILLIISIAISSNIQRAHAVYQQVDVHPILAGWGGERIEDTAQNSTAPSSVVFPGERASNFEQIMARQSVLGYNTMRASFAPYCAVLYRINNGVPQDFIGNYSATDLARAIQISRHFTFWIVVDYHGYNDVANSTLGNCWLNFWSGVVDQYKYNYTRIIWEPLNEPSAAYMPAGDTANRTAYLSQWYQAWVNQARLLGDTHWIVIQNLCSFGCSYSDALGRSQEWKAYPTVTDTINPGRIFISLHTYIDYPSYTGCPTGTTFCPTGYDWNSSAADLAARQDYLNMVNGTINTGWPILNTEGGTSCQCPSSIMQVAGTAGYSAVSLRYMQQLVNFEFNGTLANKFSSIYWLAASWVDDTPGAHVYGALSSGEWGMLVTQPFVCPALLTSDNDYDWKVNIFDLTLVASRIGSHVGDANYLDRADMNGDGKIDITDLVSVARLLGSKC